MPQPIDEAEVRHVARLARLKLTDEEVGLFTQQLGSMLEYFQQLSELDVDDVEPLAHPLPLRDVLRGDDPHTPYDPEQALSNAPQREGTFFKVPAVLDGGGA